LTDKLIAATRPLDSSGADEEDVAEEDLGGADEIFEEQEDS
jgi:ribosome maturation factor RimP